MMSLKRMLLVTVPLAALTAGAALYAAPSRPRPCGPPTGITAFLQKVGLTSARITPCETAPVAMDGSDKAGYWCADPGRHCNDGSGSGKCTSMIDESTGMWSCVCLKNGK